MSVPLIIAHRGDSSRRPENTLAAFAAALEVGVEVIELDVQLSADGQPVVIHDETVDRTTNGHGRVSELELRAIRELSAGFPERFGSQYEGERVPTLAEALAFLRGRARVMIEFKQASTAENWQEGIEARTLEQVRRAEMGEDVALISFDPRALGYVRELDPSITRGMLFVSGDAERVISRACDLGAAVVIAEKGMLCDELRDRARQAGLRLGGWLVDDPRELEALKRFELFGIGTNRPAELLEALADETL